MEEDTSQEDVPQEDQSQDETTHDSVHSCEGCCFLRWARGFIAGYWSWLKEHKYNVITGFFVAVAAVWIAFGLAGIGEQWAQDRATKQRLHLARLESVYNGIDAKSICRDYVESADPNTIRINVKRLNPVAATVAFQDANILSFLPGHKVTLLRGYLDDIDTLNQALQIHQGLLESQGYKTSQQEKEVRQEVRKIAAGVYGMALVFYEELTEYRDPELFDLEEIESLQNRARCIKERCLEGEFPPFKDK
jgi:hypothetical protein